MMWMRTTTILFLALASCGGGDDGGGAGSDTPDAGSPDTGPPPAPVDHCDFVQLPGTAGAGGTVEAGPHSAGAAEAPLVLAISTALGGYTARAVFAGNAGRVDDRDAELS